MFRGRSLRLYLAGPEVFFDVDQQRDSNWQADVHQRDCTPCSAYAFALRSMM